MLGHKSLFDYAMAKAKASPVKPIRLTGKEGLDGKDNRGEAAVVAL